MVKTLTSTIFLLLFTTAAALAQSDPVVPMWDRQVLSTPEVSIPAEAVATGLGGIVRVPVTVDASGSVVDFGDASGPGPVCAQVTRADVVALRRAAIEAARGARFAPISEGGPAFTRSAVTIEFRGTTESKVDVFTPVTAASEPTGVESGDPKKPRDPNKFTVKGDTTFSVSGAPQPDHKGPVAASKEASTERYTIAGERHYNAAPASSDASSAGKTLSGGVLNGKAQTLAKPAYPPAARAVRATGAVSVQVLIDTNGEVFSAQAVSGHPLLRPATIPAACGSSFTPTLLEGQPVKVSGIITYNFVP